MRNFALFQKVYLILFCKNPPPENELEHLLGFLEGDGGCCKQLKPNKKTFDFSYRITQKSLKILQILKRTLKLGGSLSPDPEKNPKALQYRLTFTRRDQVICFVALLYGNLRFSDRQKHYDTWAQAFLDQNIHIMQLQLYAKLRKQNKFPLQQTPESLYQLTKSVLTSAEKKRYKALLKVHETYKSNVQYPNIDLDNAWFSGFFEAEGNFRSQFYRRKDLKKGYSVDIAIEVRQNNAYQQFKPLKDRFGGHLRTEGISNQFRIASAKSVKELKDYFTKYPLRGRKHIAQSRWVRALILREQNLPLPQEGSLEYRRFVRIFTSVNNVSF